MVEARPANGTDLAPLSEALARAFHDDPVMTWMFGDGEAARSRRLRRFFRSQAERHRKHGEVLTGAGNEGGAFWDPPEGWKTSWIDLLRAAPVLVPALGPRLRRCLAGLELIERAHPRGPHWYLAMLGTDPVHQGKGVGRALLEPILDRCDAEGLGAYLESSKERNVPYYQRFGFTVTGQLDLPHGPPLWPMWREPR
ncbi:MAG TPA: GNAT family N-acetyltransferase [Acidimicrobiales bacterium]|nr:GNAT family N-acetyltransferase [Acidimicrobiales bacterium]